MTCQVRLRILQGILLLLSSVATRFHHDVLGSQTTVGSDMLGIIEMARRQEAVAAEALMAQRTLDQDVPLLESCELAGFFERVFHGRVSDGATQPLPRTASCQHGTLTLC